MLEAVRNALLEEARKSPALLSDLAGLEKYVAESYDARSFVELLQNADDAGAARFAIQRCGDYLLVANDGHAFTEAEFESLCRSAASSKHRGSSIGYRGIGFKSVVGIAETVHVLSDELEATFSRERTATELPEATRVPLIRIPHHLLPSDRSPLAPAVDRLMKDDFKTVFVFAGLIATHIEAEFAAFDSTSLLFLRNIRQVELNVRVEVVITIERNASQPRAKSLRLSGPDGVSHWRVLEQDGIALGFLDGEHGIASLDERLSVVHAFLPTQEGTGFAFKLNGDISTDPSRTRIVLDERTMAGIEVAAKIVVKLIQDCLFGNGDSGHLIALIPLCDPRIAALQRPSFKTNLYAAIQRVATGVFENVYCRPSWLNALDFEALAERVNLKVVPRKFDGIEGLTGFLKFLGAKEAVFQSIAASLERVSPTSTGAVEIVAHLATLHSTRQIEANALNPDWNLWQVGERTVPLKELNVDPVPLAAAFVERIVEKIGSPSELQRLIATMSDAATAAHLLASQVATTTTQSSTQPAVTSQFQQVTLKRWRSAEQQVLSLLLAWNWKVEDVSRQNLGYDIEGRTDEGEAVFVEVKSLDYPGQAITITSNEEAVARQKGKAYRLALVRQTNEYLEVAFIVDPANVLIMNRQCRQWVWECSAYEYAPQRFGVV